jgi:hypothetical protein
MTEATTRLLRALARLGQTKSERAYALGLSQRQLHNWERGHVPQIILKLEAQGIIVIVDGHTDRASPTESAETRI